MTCPKCGHHITPADAARALSAQRKRKGGGRKRSDKPRCMCQQNTFARAKARNFDCCKKASVK